MTAFNIANIAIAQLVLSALLASVTFIWGIFRYRRADYHRGFGTKKLDLVSRNTDVCRHTW